MTALTHIASEVITLNGRFMRQRCSWCGALLIDYDLASIAVPEGQDPTPSHWQPGGFVRVDGNLSMQVEAGDGQGPVPEDSCMNLDHAVTA